MEYQISSVQKEASLFLDRELSWLQFNQRVLELSKDPKIPLLERVRFLTIFCSNLDEFFMKRIGGLKRQVMAQVSSSGLQRISPEKQLVQIRKAILPALEEYGKIAWATVSNLESEGIKLLKWDDLTEAERESLNQRFYRNIFPALTPLSVDSGHPFPFISNLSVSFGILMKHPDCQTEELFARVKIPPRFPAWISLGEGPNPNQIRFASLYELIGRNLHLLFPGMKILEIMMFRIIRNADIERDQEDADDLLDMVADELKERRFAKVVGLEHGPERSEKILSVLMKELGITNDDIYELPIWLEFFSLDSICELKRPALKFSHWAPVVPNPFSDPDGNIFEAIRKNDILVHHPFESFTASVERFIKTAVEDPKVIAIKMTLYRTGDESPFIPLLIRAAESGKQVACLVEITARFDEERNILVAQALEKAGVHVVYGIVGLKTHCKLALVVREEENDVRCYAHIGTGNYHARTAKQYVDLGLFTAKEAFTNDVVNLFHYLTGRSLHWTFKKLLVAPIDMKESFLRMIQREINCAKSHRPAGIIAKMNNLEDREVIQALYEASAQGVEINLIIRGICCLRPGVPGLSENIRVKSILGRFLEHSRIFYFRNGAKELINGEFFMGSADWMYRNLKSRVEAIVPIEDPTLRSRFLDILNILLEDKQQSWIMQSDGTYTAFREPGANCHDKLMQVATFHNSAIIEPIGGRTTMPLEKSFVLPGLTSPTGEASLEFGSV